VRTALAFLTRLPVPVPADPSLSRAAPFFPLVGLIVGALAAGIRAAADQVLPPLPATLLAIAAALLVTGALHEDGLADVADAVGAHTTKERRLEIMRDPRVGTYGALALILAIGLTATTVAQLDTEHAVRTLIVAHVLARWAILPVSLALPPARPGGAGALLRAGAPVVAIATVIAAALALGGAPIAPGATALAAAAVAAALVALVLWRAVGGVTGDGYGATAKVAEVAVCLVLCAWWA
jgi:adenosylcobinamide-GDP ribazoletransferase